MQIKKVNPLNYVTSHPEIFISTGGVILNELVSKVASDLITLECTPFTVDLCSGWRVVSSKNNWLSKKNELSIEDIFSTLVPLPEAGQNSNRSEILLNAFCENVFVFNGEKMTLIKGEVDDELKDFLIHKYHGQIFVAFS